jgi:ribosomal 50S subunit-recycling heat shock protein
MPDGEVIKDAAQVLPQDDVEVRLARGAMECKVVAVRTDL